MITSIENKYGIISFDNSLMDQIIDEALIPHKGNYKLLKKDYAMEPEGIRVDIYTNLQFGTSINNFSTTVLNEIAQKILNNLELPIKIINLHINGIYSKKLVNRDIIIKYFNGSIISDK